MKCKSIFEYDKIDLSEGIDVRQLGGEKSRECSLCHFYYFIDKNFNYQSYYCNGCHDMNMKTMSMKNLGIAYVKGNAYRINFTFMTYNDAVNLLKDGSITNKKETLRI